MTTFRMAGMSSDDPGRLDRFDDFVRSLLPPEARPALKTVRFPETDPHVAIAWLEGIVPPVAVHRGRDGAVLLVDGEIYAADYRAGGAAAPLDPAELLTRFTADPIKALDGLDAAALLTFCNARDGAVTVARDAIGNQPVFFRREGKDLVWAADLATLMARDPEWEFQDEAVDFFLASGYVPAPWSFVKGIAKLVPGFAATRERGREVRVARYVDYRVAPCTELDQDEVVARMAALFPKAVSRRVRDMGRTGLLLSGGVDSKAVLAVMAQGQGPRPKTFTFRYGAYDGSLNESDLARACADHFGVEHYEIPMDPVRIPGMLPDMLKVFGEPFSYGLHTFMLDEVRAQGVTDLLCGTGADGAWFLGAQQIGAVIFRGFQPFVRTLMGGGVTAAQALLEGVQSAGYLRQMPAVKYHRSVQSARTLVPHLLTDFITPYYYRRHLHLDKTLAARGRQALLALYGAALEDTAELPLHQRFRVLQTRYYGADMMQNWNHWSARGHGLTIRAPYYDRETLAFLLTQPFMRQNKIELREYAATLMPREMAYVPKVPQGVPLVDWLAGPFKDWVRDTLAPERVARAGRFDPARVGRLVADYYNGAIMPPQTVWTIWNLAMVTLWQEEMRAAPARPAGRSWKSVS